MCQLMVAQCCVEGILRSVKILIQTNFQQLHTTGHICILGIGLDLQWRLMQESTLKSTLKGDKCYQHLKTPTLVSDASQVQSNTKNMDIAYFFIQVLQGDSLLTIQESLYTFESLGSKFPMKISGTNVMVDSPPPCHLFQLQRVAT